VAVVLGAVLVVNDFNLDAALVDNDRSAVGGVPG
jgi:hypothetical protein